MSDGESIARVHYFTGQFLRPQDFTDEQGYHVAMRRRHNIAHHSWGIVQGLDVVVDPVSKNPVVQPGMAIDGYGRELILPEQQPLPTTSFVDMGSNVLDVWVVYTLVGSDQAPPGYAGCDDGSAQPFYRWQERPLVRVEVPDPSYPNRRQPKGVPDSAIPFDPSQTPPDDPRLVWPVFLGQVTWDPKNQDQPYSVDPADRPCVGLVGEGIVAPSGRAWMQIGAERATDANRFAVVIPEAESGSSDQAPQPRLAIDTSGAVSIRGETTVQGDLTVAGGAVALLAGPARSPDAPWPWHIYHVEDEKQARHELRIEMGASGGNQVVVGSWSAQDKAFQPCLTIADDCTVTVHGNLVVEGRIEQAAPAATPQLSPDAERFIQAGYLSGIGGASALVTRVFQSPTPVDHAAVAQSLASSPNDRAAFTDLIKNAYPQLARELKDAL
jgi:hypothetical protein